MLLLTSIAKPGKSLWTGGFCCMRVWSTCSLFLLWCVIFSGTWFQQKTPITGKWWCGESTVDQSDIGFVTPNICRILYHLGWFFGPLKIPYGLTVFGIYSRFPHQPRHYTVVIRAAWLCLSLCWVYLMLLPVVIFESFLRIIFSLIAETFLSNFLSTLLKICVQLLFRPVTIWKSGRSSIPYMVFKHV